MPKFAPRMAQDEIKHDPHSGQFTSASEASSFHLQQAEHHEMRAKNAGKNGNTRLAKAHTNVARLHKDAAYQHNNSIGSTDSRKRASRQAIQASHSIKGYTHNLNTHRGF